jgi:hypothetical protein
MLDGRPVVDTRGFHREGQSEHLLLQVINFLVLGLDLSMDYAPARGFCLSRM